MSHALTMPDILPNTDLDLCLDGKLNIRGWGGKNRAALKKLTTMTAELEDSDMTPACS